MSKQTGKYILLAVSLFIGIFITAAATAGATSLKEGILQETKQVAGDTYSTQESGEQSLTRTIQRGIQAVIGILGVVAVIMILYAGFTWLTAGGNEEQVKKAKKIIKQAVIGLIIISLAYALVAFVLGQRIFGGAPPQPQPGQQVPGETGMFVG